MKNRSSLSLKYIGLNFFLLVATNIVFSQNNLTKPTVNFFISTDIFAKPPTVLYIHKSAEYFGAEINYSTYPYFSDVPKEICSIKTRESLNKTIIQTKKTFPYSLFYLSDTKFSSLEITDTITLDFVKISNDYKFKLYCLIPIDSTKDEAELIYTFESLLKEIEGIPIPKYKKESREYPVYYRSITNIPMLAIKNTHTYNKYLDLKFISEVSELIGKLNKNQKLEINYNSEISIQRASLFSLYISKNINAKIQID